VTGLRRRLRRLPLRVRLTLAGTLLLPLALAVVFGLVYLRFEAGLNATIDADLRARADALAPMLRRDRPTTLHGRAAVALLRPLGAFAQVVDGQGRTLSASAPVAGLQLLTPGQARAATRRVVHTDRGRLELVAKRSRLLAIPLRKDATALVIGRSLKDREGANESFGRALLIGGPLAVLLSAGACYLAAAAALRPVERMRRRAAAITGAKPSARLPVPEADDEIGRLGRTLNDMIARLEDALTRQRTLTQNASHELRTPLTVLTGELELGLQHDLPVASREALTTALGEAQRVSRLADDLLTLAQVEESELPLAVEDADVNEVVRTATARAQARPLADGRTIVVDAETAIARVDVTRVEQAVGNLIDNALIHGRGTVTVGLRSRLDEVEIVVSDEGAGIPAELRSFAFDRFARAKRAPRDGAGLGLAIVKTIAEAHGGTATIDAEHRVVMTLPRGPS
jgi:two-component system OmpR family sensor kinase